MIKNNNRKRKVILCIPAIVIILLIFFLMRILLNKNYIDNDVFGNIRYIFKYENLKEERGKILKEELVNDNMWVVIYDDIKVVYNYQTDTNTVGRFMWAQIDNDEYKFGEQEIAVGMSRECVEKALKNSKRPEPCIQECDLFDPEGNVHKGITEDYYDDVYDYGMGFVYDEDDCVKYIRIYFGL